METNEYAIQYLRPDGWWDAGGGHIWTDREDCEEAAKAHEWGNTQWRIVLVGSPEDEDRVNKEEPR